MYIKTVMYSAGVMVFLWVVLGSFGVSIASALAVDALVTTRVPVVGSLAGLQKTYNPGIAFGVHLPPYVQEGLVLLALVLVAVTALRTAKTTVQRLGFGLIVGGALANLLDRAMDGYVTDFFQIGSFYIFNVADSCITVGVAVLLVEGLMVRRKSTVGGEDGRSARLQ